MWTEVGSVEIRLDTEFPSTLVVFLFCCTSQFSKDTLITFTYNSECISCLYEKLLWRGLKSPQATTSWSCLRLNPAKNTSQTAGHPKNSCLLGLHEKEAAST